MPDAAEVAAGSDAVTAQRQAYIAIFGAVQQQSAMLSFLDIFMLLTWVFLLMIPLVFIMKKPRGPVSAEAAVH